jgi:hypothetical protein
VFFSAWKPRRQAEGPPANGEMAVIVQKQKWQPEAAIVLPKLTISLD